MGLIEEHLEKYPLMQIEDKIKLLMQSIMGPGHLVNDKEKILCRLNREYNEIKDIIYPYNMIEEIGNDFARVYLKPFYEQNQSFDKLVDLFMLSCNQIKDVKYLRSELLELRKTQNEHDKKFIDEYLESGNILISHSEIYKKITIHII